MPVGSLNLMMIGFPGPTELVIIFVIILVLFGGAKLPDMARNIGRGMRVFKEEANTLRREIDLSDDDSKGTSKASAESKGASEQTSAQSETSEPEKKASAS